MTEYAPAKTVDYPSNISKVQNFACCQKYLKNNQLHSFRLRGLWLTL